MFPKFPAKATHILVPLGVSFIMTGTISAITLIRATGLTPETLNHWPSAWATSWALGFPILLFVLPLVRKIVSKLTY